MANIELGTYLRGNSAKYHECIEACVTWLETCEMCSDACLDDEDIAMMRSCIRLDRDCTDACAAAIRGPLAAELCRTCAEACDARAAECEKHAGMAEHCRLCAEACGGWPRSLTRASYQTSTGLRVPPRRRITRTTQNAMERAHEAQ